MSKRPAKPKIIIIAGPNGAGKTTFAQEFLPLEADCPDFLNADLIARGLSPFIPEKAAIQAGKIMLSQIAGKVAARESFAIETTLAGSSYARHIPEWRRAGYFVKMWFLSLPSAKVAIARVKSRVIQGGHDIPEDVIRRRFISGVKNFHATYKSLVDAWVLLDNSVNPPTVIAEGARQ